MSYPTVLKGQVLETYGKRLTSYASNTDRVKANCGSSEVGVLLAGGNIKSTG